MTKKLKSCSWSFCEKELRFHRLNQGSLIIWGSPDFIRLFLVENVHHLLQGHLETLCNYGGVKDVL